MVKRVGVMALSMTVGLAGSAVVYGASDGPDPQARVRNIIVYGDVGRSLFSDAGVRHAYVGGGIKLLIQPK